MEIAIVAHDKKKELMAEFCTAYCGILCKHNLCAKVKVGKAYTACKTAVADTFKKCSAVE
jgi:methylglyoxal synthase